MVDIPESHVSFGEGTLGEGWLTNHDLNKTPKLPSKSFAAESFFFFKAFFKAPSICICWEKKFRATCWLAQNLRENRKKTHRH